MSSGKHLQRVDAILSRYGYCSRSEARAWVRRGAVTLNDIPVQSPAEKVSANEIKIDGNPVDFPNGILVMLHKPAGYVCSHDQEEGPTIYDLLPERWTQRNPPVTTVGRLDKDTTGAVMLKILPNCQNIDCSNPRYKKFWERMAEAGLPLLAHTGGEHTVPVVRKEFSDPRTLKLPLEVGVKVIAAHCATKSGLFDPEYFHVFAEMTQHYPNLYGDSSAFNVPIRGQHISECLNEPLSDHLVHGSDFPVPVYGFWAWRRGQLDWKTFRKWDSHWNVLERDYQLKRAIGFPMEHFTRGWELLRLRKD